MFWFLKQGFSVALTILELTFVDQAGLELRSLCLCLTSGGIKGMHHHCSIKNKIKNKNKKSKIHWVVEVQAFNPSTWETGKWISEFKTSLFCRLSSSVCMISSCAP